MQSLSKYFKGKSHVVWDWNGTLLADVEHAVDTVNHLLLEYGLAPTTVEKYKKEFGFPVYEYYKKIGFDPTPEKFHVLSEKFNQLFHDGLDRCRLWPGAHDLLKSVKDSGRVQSLLSASEHNMLLNSIRQFGVDSLFDHVMGIADKLAGSKIDFGHKLMAKAGVSAEETILIGDTLHDMEVAKALGVDLILVDHGHQCATRLHHVHHQVVCVIDSN